MDSSICLTLELQNTYSKGSHFFDKGEIFIPVAQYLFRDKVKFVGTKAVVA